MFSHIKRSLIARGYWKDRDEEDVGGTGGEEEVVGEGNPHDDARARLVQGHDERMDEASDFRDVEEGEQADVAAEGAEEEESSAAEEPKKFKIKVNGQDVELTEAELIERAQKADAADEKFQEAARMRREAEELRGAEERRQPPEQGAGDDLDPVALVRAIQMGTEEEAAEALRKVMKQRPSLEADANVIDDRIRQIQAFERYKTEFSDIFNDPDLQQMAFARDHALVKAKDTSSYWDRYSKIGTELRAKFGKKPDTAAEDKVQRKAEVVTLKRANARQAAPAEPDQEESPSAVIASMAKARGQTQ